MSFDEKRLEEIRHKSEKYEIYGSPLWRDVDDLIAMVDDLRAQVDVWKSNSNNWEDACRRVQVERDDARTFAEYRKTHRDAAIGHIRMLKATLERIVEIRRLCDRENFGCMGECSCTECTLCVARAAIVGLEGVP